MTGGGCTRPGPAVRLRGRTLAELTFPALTSVSFAGTRRVSRTNGATGQERDGYLSSYLNSGSFSRSALLPRASTIFEPSSLISRES